MLDHDESFPVFSSVVFGADRLICHHTTFQNNITIIVYIVILIFFRGYAQDICKHCHEADNPF